MNIWMKGIGPGMSFWPVAKKEEKVTLSHEKESVVDKALDNRVSLMQVF